MKYITNIGTFLKTLTNPYPVRDWYIVFALSSLVALVFVGISVYFFIGIQAGFIVGGSVSSENPTQTISHESLKKTLEVYEKRSVNFNENNYPVPPVTDPSR